MGFVSSIGYSVYVHRSYTTYCRISNVENASGQLYLPNFVQPIHLFNHNETFLSRYYIVAWRVAAQLKPDDKIFNGLPYSITESVGDEMSHYKTYFQGALQYAIIL